MQNAGLWAGYKFLSKSLSYREQVFKHYLSSSEKKKEMKG